MIMNAEQFNEKLANGMKLWRQSLFLSSFEVTSEHEREVKECPDKTKMRHLRFAVFFQRFFRTSNGATFNDDLRTFLGDDKQFKESWNVVFRPELPCNSPLEGEHETLIKSKCWILEGVEENEPGRGSEVWNALRDVIHHCKVMDGRLESFEGRKYPFLRLLFSADTVERREYCQLVKWLAFGPPSAFPEPSETWSYLVSLCEKKFGRGAYVNWYLREEDDEVAFGVGFDGFPNDHGDGGWREYWVDGKTDTIRAGTSAWFEPVPWNVCLERGSRIRYKGLSTKNSDIPHLFKAGKRFETFIRYRAGSSDPRKNWWRHDTKPELAFLRNEFLVCSFKASELDRLPWRGDLTLKWETSETGSFKIQVGNGPLLQLFFRKFRIVERPADIDTLLTLEGGVSIIVKGKSAFAQAEGNALGIRRNRPCGNLVSFSSDGLRLFIGNARADASYRWVVRLDGCGEQAFDGGDVECRWRDFAVSGKEPDLREFKVSCWETVNGKERRLDSLSGVMVPAFLEKHLSDFPSRPLPDGWSLKTSDTPISDRIDGIRKITVASSGGRNETLCIPDSKLAWWFEINNLHYGDDDILYPNQANAVPSFSDDQLKKTYLCVMPGTPDQVRPAGWNVTKDGYWRCPLSTIVSASEYTYDSDRAPSAYRWNETGPIMFKYWFRPTLPCFCKDLTGRLGLFAPESDCHAYEILAFSDQTRELLLDGRKIGLREPNVAFTDVSEPCNTFLRETDGWDVYLTVRSTEDATDDDELFRPPVFALARESKPSRVLRIVDRHEAGYDDKQIKAAHLFRDMCSGLPPNHEIRRAYAFRAPPLSYAQTKDVWEQEAQVLAATTSCDGDHQWLEKLRQWRACGFHPFLEGVSDQLWTLARNWFFNHLPTPPKDIDDLLTGHALECWRSFVEKWGESNQPFDENAATDAVRSLGWRQGTKRRKVLREYIETTRVRLADLRRACFCGCTDPEPKPWIGSAPEWTPVDVLNKAQENNEVNFRWGELDGLLENASLLPAEVLESIPGRDAVKTLFRGILSHMADTRLFAGSPSDQPTDREWLFCLAASSILLGPGSSPEHGALQILSVLFSKLSKMDSGDPKRQKFFKYRAVCRACLGVTK